MLPDTYLLAYLSIHKAMQYVYRTLLKQPRLLSYHTLSITSRNISLLTPVVQSNSVFQNFLNIRKEMLMNKQSHFLSLRQLSRHLGNSARGQEQQNSSNRSNPQQPDNLYIGLFIVTSIGIGFYMGYLWSKHRSSSPYEIIPMSSFMKLLERGEVKIIEIPHRESYAKVTLHGQSNSDDNRIILVPMYPSAAIFERGIRLQEDRWGIAENGRIPIYHGGESITQETPTSLAMFIGTVFLTTLVVTVAVMAALKRRRPPPPGYPGVEAIKADWRQTAQRRRRDAGATKQQPQEAEVDDQQKQSRAKPRSPDQEFDHDQRYHGSGGSGGFPFSWDPFGGSDSIRPVTTNITFKDVAGLHASKQEVMEFVAYLRDPRKFQALGAKLPKGALLLGPPGTGKTLLVKALANEAGVPFFSMAGSEFVEVIGGLGASRIRKLFKTARSTRQAIIFIDELDSLGRRRGSSSGSGPPGGGGGGVSEMEQTLNQLLVEMDGMDTTEGTIVFAATNRPDLLDKALLRAGRFDRHIFIDLPNLAERKELVAMYVDKYRLAASVNKTVLIERLSGWTPGMSGADIARLCNEAALIAARQQPDSVVGVTQNDFEMAFERVIAGAAKQSNPLSPPERRVAAVQEAGRALVAWLLPGTGLKPVKVSIVPRTAASSDSASTGLGFTQMIADERKLYTSEELKDRMSILLGGRAAEQVIFNAVSDASQRYLKEASDLAMKQVRELGLSKVIGNVSFAADASGNEFVTKPYSQRTQAMIEAEAQSLVTSSFMRCTDLLLANQKTLVALIDALLAREVLTYDELVQICGRTPHGVQGNPDPVDDRKV